MSLGGGTHRLIVEYQNRHANETDSTSPSLKNETPTRSSSSSPIPSLISPVLKNPGFLNSSEDLDNMYAPLETYEPQENGQSPTLQGPMSWSGGWSNRANSLGFGFGGTQSQPGAEESSSLGFDSVDITPDDADVESANEVEVVDLGHIPIEHVPVNIDMAESMDEVQIIQLDSTEEEERQSA
jgi:hypothetical protein